jgi:hypothetical protein
MSKPAESKGTESKGTESKGTESKGTESQIIVEEDISMTVEPMHCPNCNNISYEPYDEYDHCGSYCASKGKNITCWGCREDQPNQLAHMDKGGCLYDESRDLK